MSKRQTFIAVVLAGTLAAQAADYKYLNIEKTDGTTHSLTAVGLNITYSNGNLNAANDVETTTIALSDITRMYFSVERNGTAVKGTVVDTGEKDIKMYDLNGRLLPQGTMPAKGVYIVKEKGKTRKSTTK